MTNMPGMYHNPVEITGNIRVHHTEPVIPQPPANINLNRFCSKCDDWHDSIGECPYDYA